MQCLDILVSDFVLRVSDTMDKHGHQNHSFCLALIILDTLSSAFPSLCFYHIAVKAGTLK